PHASCMGRPTWLTPPSGGNSATMTGSRSSARAAKWSARPSRGCQSNRRRSGGNDRGRDEGSWAAQLAPFLGFPVPVPIAGAGLPGMILILAGGGLLSRAAAENHLSFRRNPLMHAPPWALVSQFLDRRRRAQSSTH